MVRFRYFSVCNSISNGVAAVVTLEIFIFILVSERGHSFCLGSSATGLTLLMSSTLGGAGRIYVNDPLTRSMTVRRNILLLYKCKAAKSTNRAGSDTSSGTSSLYAGNVYANVTESSNKSFAANLTKLRVKARSVYTGCMTERITVSLATGSASLSGNAISLYPIVTESGAKLKGAKLTSHGGGTSSVNKGMCAKSGNEGYCSIIAEILNLKGISLNTVFANCRKHGNTSICGKSVLDANYKIENNIFALCSSKCVAEEECAILFYHLNGNNKGSEFNRKSEGANITYVIVIIVGMCCNSGFFTALTLVEVNERI